MMLAMIIPDEAHESDVTKAAQVIMREKSIQNS